ncbi:alpha/beta hydrolase [Nocardioides sp. 1609]|uniref:alpha/beta hydrolase n=1 Tax=Nocardioides sp. 1609 TaxID=2508327 RepID=UPI00106F1651|nr:alpha/beta hydrolase [Nocardioides sp. 1609]
MTLHPRARVAVERAAAETPVFTEGYDVAGARVAAREAAARQPREDVERALDLDAGGVPCRLYVPADAAPGVVVHAHGGGFVLNDVDVHDASCRRLANRAGTAVLSVDYRLAPEDPFPAAVEDLDAVVAWLDEHGDGHGLAGPTYGHGDSAGANLVLVAALRHPDRFRALALIYPFLDPSAAGASHREETEGFDPREVAWYWEQYAGGDARHHDDPDLAPLLSDRLDTLPPTFVMTSEHDPLRDEGEVLVARLAEAGVEVLGVRYLGQVHGFWRHPDVFPAAEPLLRQAAAFLRDH